MLTADTATLSYSVKPSVASSQATLCLGSLRKILWWCSAGKTQNRFSHVNGVLRTSWKLSAFTPGYPWMSQKILMNTSPSRVSYGLAAPTNLTNIKLTWGKSRTSTLPISTVLPTTSYLKSLSNQSSLEPFQLSRLWSWRIRSRKTKNTAIRSSMSLTCSPN